jgi:hypothetical protein
LCIYPSKIQTHPMTRRDFSSWKSHNGSRQQLQQWQPFRKVINCSLHKFIVAVYSGCVTQNSFCLKTWGCFKVTRYSEIPIDLASCLSIQLPTLQLVNRQIWPLSDIHHIAVIHSIPVEQKEICCGITSLYIDRQ